MKLRGWWRRRDRRDHYLPTGDAGSLQRGLALLQQRWPDVQSESDAEPIFLLSAGWRSGSTLLQRRVMTSPDVLIWGEPYGHAALVDQLAYPIRCVTERWPHDEWFDVPAPDDHGARQAWMANLYPPVAALLAAHVQWFEQLFALPAVRAGYRRWGLKEIRLTGDHARYLRWIFPRARFVMLYRNPYDAYRSYRRWRSWYLRWPDDPVTEPDRFGRHWRTLVESFLAESSAVSALIVRYDDLANERFAVDQLADHLGLPPPAAITLDRIDSRKRPGKPAPVELEPIPEDELATLRAAVEPLANRLGYLYR